MENKITGNDPISVCILRQTGDTEFRLATEKDLRESAFLVSNYGLTKREHFAAMAMQGVCASTNPVTLKEVAQWSVKMADALIEELNEKES